MGERDVDLLPGRIAGDGDDLHAVAQRRRQRAEIVGGGDEHHLRQIERHLQIMIGEGGVLLGIEHLEQRRRRIAAEIGGQLVDLVEHEDRVARAGALEPLHDAAGQGAHVGAAVPADLRLVAHTAERDAHELASERARDRAAERGLAHTGRADEQQDRRLLAGGELAHREVFEDALLHLGQAAVIGLEDGASGGDIELVVAGAGPGQLEQPLEIGARDVGLRRALAERSQPPRLAQRRCLGFGRKLGRADARHPLVVLVVGAIVAELSADLGQLRAQDLAPGLGALLFRLLVGVAARDELAQHRLEPRAHVELQEQLPSLLAPEWQPVGHRIGQRRWTLRGRHLFVFVQLAPQRLHPRRHAARLVALALGLHGTGDPNLVVRLGLDDVAEHDALERVHRDEVAPVGQAHDLGQLGRDGELVFFTHLQRHAGVLVAA